MLEHKLLKKILSVSSVREIDKLLDSLDVVNHESYFIDHKGNANGAWQPGHLHWMPVGQDRGNGGRIKLAGNPMNPIAERLVNGMEALIELHRLQELALDSNIPCPISPRAAVLKYFKLPGLDSVPRTVDKLERITLEKIVKEVRELLEVRLSSADTKRKFTVTIEDRGMGQSPERIHQTLLSLGQTDKADKPYMIGLFGQGGSSAYAASERSTIISRRAPDIRSTSDSTDIGWTVVKQIFPTNRRDPYFAYLVAKSTGEVPRISAECADEAGFSHGSRFRHIDYDFGGSAAEVSRALYTGLNHVLFNPVLPYNLFSLRDQPDAMQGTGQRLARRTSLILRSDAASDKQQILDKTFPSQPIGEIAEL